MLCFSFPSRMGRIAAKRRATSARQDLRKRRSTDMWARWRKGEGDMAESEAGETDKARGQRKHKAPFSIGSDGQGQDNEASRSGTDRSIGWCCCYWSLLSIPFSHEPIVAPKTLDLVGAVALRDGGFVDGAALAALEEQVSRPCDHRAVVDAVPTGRRQGKAMRVT